MGRRPVYITKLSNEIQFAEETELKISASTVLEERLPAEQEGLADEGGRPSILIAKIDIELRLALGKARRAGLAGVAHKDKASPCPWDGKAVAPHRNGRHAGCPALHNRAALQKRRSPAPDHAGDIILHARRMEMPLAPRRVGFELAIRQKRNVTRDPGRH